MALVPLSQLLHHAQSHHYAVGYFEAWDMYSFEAVLEAAEEEKSPVVLGFGGTMMNQSWLARFGIAPLGAFGYKIAQTAQVPVAFILNEVLELAHIQQGVSAGFNVVMLDSCRLPFAENVAITRQVIQMAKPHGIEVQAEFGRLPTFGETHTGTLTDPQEACRFVEMTGVDFLAVSIGNVHLQTQTGSPVDIHRLQAIRQAVAVPLVLHGGSGFPQDQIDAVIRHGISLFHFGTLMKKAFLESARKTLQPLDPHNADYQALVGSRKETDFLYSAKQEIKKVVRQRLQSYHSAGQAS